MGSTDGPEIMNFQREFWLLAVERFDKIRQKWIECAIQDDDEGYSDPPAYTENEFKVDAAVALVLAGTSISELIGQNPAASEQASLREWTKPPGDALREIFGDAMPSGTASFFKIYNDLRHFGPAKYPAVLTLTEEIFCEHLRTAQELWRMVLQHRREPVGQEFCNVFTFG